MVSRSEKTIWFDKQIVVSLYMKDFMTWIFVLIFILFSSLFFSILTLQRTRKSSLPKIRVFPFSKSTIGEKSVLWNFCFNFKMCRFNAYFKLLRGENILMETIFPWIRLTVLWGFLMICHEQVKQIEMVQNIKKPFLDEYSLTQRKRI